MNKYQLEALLEIGIYNVGLSIAELLQELDDKEKKRQHQFMS